MGKLISKIYQKSGNHVSFEIFPPKTTSGLKQIYQTIANLRDLQPAFFSVTYGAGGSTAEKSLEIASAVQNLAQATCMAHFTCVGMNQKEVKDLLGTFSKHGISNVLALRGDPPSGQDKFVKTEGGFGHATELVQFIRKEIELDLGVLVAGYPEGHQENPSKEKDFQYLLEKVKTGVDGIVTQLFFNNQKLLDFKERLDQAGVKAPLVPGIFPISNAKQIQRIIQLSGASIPKKLERALELYQDSKEDMEKFGTDYAVEQVEQLLSNGLRCFHFYTMNRHQQTRSILTQLKQHFTSLNFDSI